MTGEEYIGKNRYAQNYSGSFLQGLMETAEVRNPSRRLEREIPR
jgi:hypothetical protein